MVLALELSSSRDERLQIGDGGTRAFEIGVRPLRVSRKCDGLGAQANELRFQSRLPLPRLVAGGNGSFGSKMRGTQRALGLLEPVAHAAERLANGRGSKPSRENRPLAYESAARDRSAAGDLLAAQRHDRVTQGPFANELDADVQRRHDKDVTDEKVNDAGKPRFGLHEHVRVAQDAGEFGEPIVDAPSFAICQRIERQKSRAPGFFAIEKIHAALGILGRGRHHVRKPRAKRNVHRARVALVGRNEVRNDSLDPAQLAALPRLHDCPRTWNVPFERVFEFFDRMKPRFGGFHLDGMVAVRGQRARDFILRECGFALRVFGTAACVEQSLLRRFQPPPALAAAMRCAAGRNFDFFRTLPCRAFVALEAFDLATTALRMRATLGPPGRELHRSRFDLSQAYGNLLEFGSSSGERRGGGELPLARRLDLLRERRQSFV